MTLTHTVKNQTVKSCGCKECNNKRNDGNRDCNDQRLLHIDAKQNRCKTVGRVSKALCSCQHVYKFVAEQELDRTGFKQSAQNAENARVNEEGAYNENGQRYKGKEVSGAQELDDDHVGQDQDGSKKE